MQITTPMNRKEDKITETTVLVRPRLLLRVHVSSPPNREELPKFIENQMPFPGSTRKHGIRDLCGTLALWAMRIHSL